MDSVEIELLGRKYFFRSDDPDGLKKTATYLETQIEKLNRRFNTVDQTKLFVLYALTLTEKYLEEKDNSKKLEQQFEQIKAMLSKLELEK